MNVRSTVRVLRRQQTPAERSLWAALREHQLDGLQFRRQFPIGRFVADFYCAKARLVVEVDGPIHTEPHQAAHDRDRDELFQNLNLTVLRVTNDDVLNDLDGTLQRIRTAIQQSQL